MDERQERERDDRREGDGDIRPSVPPPRRVAVSRAPDAAWDALPPMPEQADERVRWTVIPFLAWGVAGVFFICCGVSKTGILRASKMGRLVGPWIPVNIGFEDWFIPVLLARRDFA